MKSIYLTIFSLFILFSQGCSQESHIDTNLIGLVQTPSGFIYIDTSGNPLFSTTYESAAPFSEGMAFVKDGGSWHVIDTSGTKLFPAPENYYPTTFLNGWALLNFNARKFRHINKDGIINSSFEGLVRPFSCGRAAASNQDISGFIDTSGTMKFTYSLDSMQQIHDFNEGRACFRSVKSFKWGFIDIDGEIAVHPQYYEVGQFSEALCRVSTVTEDRKVVWNYINENGETVLELNCSDATDFSSGMASIKLKDGTWRIIDKAGKVLFEHFINLHFSEDLAVCYSKEKGKIGFVDASGSFIIEPQFEWASNFKNGYAIIEKDGKMGYIDSNGEIVILPAYSKADHFVNPNETNRIPLKY